MQQIKEGKTAEEIRKSWQPGLNAFKKIRKKYLLYEDNSSASEGEREAYPSAFVA